MKSTLPAHTVKAGYMHKCEWFGAHRKRVHVLQLAEQKAEKSHKRTPTAGLGDPGSERRVTPVLRICPKHPTEDGMAGHQTEHS